MLDRASCFIRSTNFESIEVQGFADSSTVAFASVVYLRVIYEGEIDTMLVISKNKIAPIKRLSVPRLELLAALITSRSVHCVKEALETLNKVNINKVYFWSDSFTTLFWIKGVNTVEIVCGKSSQGYKRACPARPMVLL